MDMLTKKDVQAFAKVLQAIASTLEKEPDIILDFLGDISPENKKLHTPQLGLTERVQSTDLFGYAKEHTQTELLNFLKEFSAEELKALIKKHSFGYTKLKTVDSIVEYVADQINKRTTDVFLTHQK